MKNLGLATPQILLPNSKINMKKWAVIACDQYNSNFEYWDDVEKIVGNTPSTLRMILPEIYLDDEEDTEARISEVSHVMEDYLSDGVIEALPEGFVLVQRTLPGGTRTGLMGMIDLEHYEFETDANPKVRPTEETVLERIPPRVKIRKPALLESPHILVLLNDKEKKVIEPIAAKAKKLPTLYDFELMKDGGTIKGSFVGEQEDIDQIYEKLSEVDASTDILFCVGDGNHSLATAKTVWDEYKQGLSEDEQENHPKRFALVEIVNLYDDGLSFEPIHRVVFGVDSNKLVPDLIKLFNKNNMDAKIFFKRSSATTFVKNTGGQNIDFIAKDKKGYIKLDNPENELEGVNFQNILDEYLKQNPDVKVEYIHGLDEVERLCEQKDNTGFVLPKLEKDSFIDVLSKEGVLPKKCFSLGEADEKRFYLECRLLDAVSDMGEHAEIIPSNDFEDDAEINNEIDNQLETTADQKKKWFYDGNNEDIISFAFSDEDSYLDEDDVDLNANMYLGKKEVKKLKKQKRLEEILEHESSELVKDTKDYLDEFELDIPLTRREKKLIAKQREYEILLEQIGEEKKKNQGSNSYVESNISINSSDNDGNNEQEQEPVKDEKTYNDEIDELLNEGGDENVKLSRKEKRALKKEQRLMKKLDELGIDEQDLNSIDDKVSESENFLIENSEADEFEQDIESDIIEGSEQLDILEEDEEIFNDELDELKATWSKRKQEKKEEKQQRMQAMLDSLEQEQISDDEQLEEYEEKEQNTKQGIFGFLSGNKRVNNKQKMKQQMEDFFVELDEKESGKYDDKNEIVDANEKIDNNTQENIFAEQQTIDEQKVVLDNKVESEEEKTNIKNDTIPKKVNKEIADALNGAGDENIDYANKEYLLEKVRLEVEKEKLALEKYRIKNEAKLKRQIERDKRRELLRMKKEKDSFTVKNSFEQNSENTNGDFADTIGEVIKEINKEKPEVRDLITSTGIVTTSKKDLNTKKKKKHKRGVLVVKRSGSSYGEDKN